MSTDYKFFITVDNRTPTDFDYVSNNAGTGDSEETVTLQITAPAYSNTQVFGVQGQAGTVTGVSGDVTYKSAAGDGFTVTYDLPVVGPNSASIALFGKMGTTYSVKESGIPTAGLVETYTILIEPL